jgi:cysteine desulfurase
MIYADNAATTQLDMDAFEAMKPFLLQNYANASQPYSFSRGARNALKDARHQIAEIIGADEEEIFFTSCGTESDNWAIKIGASERKHIITSNIEHHAILNSCKTIEESGIEVTYVPVTQNGEVDLRVLESAMTHKTGLVSIMFANNEIGTIQPIKEIVDIAHEHGYVCHTDAVQAVGHIPINVHELGVDMLSASAHKFNGPKGIGFLYVKRGTVLSAFIDGGSQESGLRAGTENVASIVAMSVALKNNYKEMERNRTHLLNLETALMSKLERSGLDYIRNGSSNRIPGNISLSFKNAEGEMLLHRLDLQKICISTGSACDSKNTQISHVIKSINVPDAYSKGTIRISFGKYNITEEAEKIADALIRIMK